MKRILTSAFMLLLISFTLFGQDKGTYSFLRNDIGARAAALNGSFVSMTNDPNLLF
jgi:hypothetical protein